MYTYIDICMYIIQCEMQLSEFIIYLFCACVPQLWKNAKNIY